VRGTTWARRAYPKWLVVEWNMKKLVFALGAAAVAALLSGCAYDTYGDGYGYGNGYGNRYDNGDYYNRGSSRAFDCPRNYDRRYCYDYRR
jgi:hypothetical protein